MSETPPPALPPITAPAGLRPTVARVSMWTADAQRLERFYAGLFGFHTAARSVLGEDDASRPIIRSWGLPPGATMEVLLLRAPRGNTELGITSAIGAEVGPPAASDGPARAGDTYLVLYVPDLDTVIERAHTAGAVFAREPKRLYGQDGRSYYEMAVRDPDGRLLLVVEDVLPAAG